MVYSMKQYIELNKFPSPIGVLYISMSFTAWMKQISSRFRPLLGFFIFQWRLWLLILIKMRCFRPLLGFFIFQYSQSNRHCKTGWKVSVPYWGSLYFNAAEKHQDEFDERFPSPIGVLYISMAEKFNNDLEAVAVSVPYWGSLYFNRYRDSNKSR